MKLWLELAAALALIAVGLACCETPNPRAVQQAIWTPDEVIQMMPPPPTITICGDHGAGLWCYTN